MSPMILDHHEIQGFGTLQRKSTHYEITPATLDDVRRLVDIEFHAFENERTNQVLSYRDYKKPAHFERSVHIYTNVLAPQTLQSHDKIAPGRRSNSRSQAQKPWLKTRFLKVVDLQTEEVVSFAKAEIMSYSPQELRGPADVGHEGEPRMNRDWFALNEKFRREYMGLAKHCYICMLATRPCYQHNGAGTMLLDALLTEADEAGVEIYLEATDTAKPLYKKHGFVTVNELRFNPADYGVRGLDIERQTVMVRGALDQDGSREEVKSWDIAVAQAQSSRL